MTDSMPSITKNTVEQPEVAGVSTGSNLTPLMQQYHEIKGRYPNALLFFRMGDFFELFYDDAKVAAKILNIALTSRNKNEIDPVAMCGVPHFSAPQYIQKLVSVGYSVAVCEQLEDPAQVKQLSGKRIVNRDVVRVITPGTNVDGEFDATVGEPLLCSVFWEHRRNIFFVTLANTAIGVWRYGKCHSVEQLQELFSREFIVEVVLSEADQLLNRLLVEKLSCGSSLRINAVPKFYFDSTYALESLKQQFQMQHLSALSPDFADQNSDETSSLISSIGALVKYQFETFRTSQIENLHTLEPMKSLDQFELDAGSCAALEVFPQGVSDFNFYRWLNYTSTAMGARLLREWLKRPLISVRLIQERQKTAQTLGRYLDILRRELNAVYDLERLASRLTLSKSNFASARDLLTLSKSITTLNNLLGSLRQHESLPVVQRLQQMLSSELIGFATRVEAEMVDPPPLSMREGGLFRKGFHPELDELIDLADHGEQWMLQYEAEQKQRTGINSLKVRFNRVFGYYIEVTKANLKQVPLDYIRKQTTANGERFITDELKQFEDRVLNAEKRRQELEYALFRSYVASFQEHSKVIFSLARQVAELDVLQSFEYLRQKRDLVYPEVYEDVASIRIIDGYHPMVATSLESRSEAIIKNSIYLNHNACSFVLLTGPNMGGKSTLLRQVALAVLAAQIGAPVAASQMQLGVVDQILTRIGAQDNIADARSTFMVEMTEMNTILRRATERSLVVVDEVGRGTSTFDGLSLAWAIALELAQRRCLTICSTHYHEMTELPNVEPVVKNFHMAVAVEPVQQNGMASNQVRFLYKLTEGPSTRSYGILVAELAGLPESVLSVANKKLEALESAAGLHSSPNTKDWHLKAVIERKSKRKKAPEVIAKSTNTTSTTNINDKQVRFIF